MNNNTTFAYKTNKMTAKATPVPASNDEDWITQKEAVAILGCKVDTLRRYRKRGLVKVFRTRPMGRGFQYSRKEINSLFINSPK